MKIKHLKINLHYFLGFNLLYPMIVSLFVTVLMMLSKGETFVDTHLFLIDTITAWIVYPMVLLFIYQAFKPQLKIDFNNFKTHLSPMIFDVFKSFFSLYVISIIMNIFIFIMIQQDAANQAMIENAFKDTPLLIIFAAVVFAPFVEEIVFRGSLFNLFKKKFSPSIAAILSGFMFGFIHISASILSGNYMDIVYLLSYGTMGYFLGMSYQKTNNIYVPIMVHAINNIIAIILMVVGG